MNCLPRRSVVRYLSKGGESGEGGVDVFGKSRDVVFLRRRIEERG